MPIRRCSPYRDRFGSACFADQECRNNRYRVPRPETHRSKALAYFVNRCPTPAHSLYDRRFSSRGPPLPDRRQGRHADEFAPLSAISPVITSGQAEIGSRRRSHVTALWLTGNKGRDHSRRASCGFWNTSPHLVCCDRICVVALGFLSANS
jgi:hypothetical protein